MIFFDAVLKKVLQPSQGIEQTAAMEKSINVMIDDLTAKLKEMKTKHMEHIKAYVDRELGGNTLRRKLYNKDKVEQHEATGDCVSRMMRDDIFKLPFNTTNPYRFPSEELTKKITLLRAEFYKLAEKVE